ADATHWSPCASVAARASPRSSSASSADPEPTARRGVVAGDGAPAGITAASRVPHDGDFAVVAHRYELFSALRLLRRGYTLARFRESPRCAIAGWILYSAFPDLERYELIQPVDNPDGFEGMEYYRISS